MIEMQQIDKKHMLLENIPEFNLNVEPYFKLLMSNSPRFSLEVTDKTGKKIVKSILNVEIG
jgi:hypothetical protein